MKSRLYALLTLLFVLLFTDVLAQCPVATGDATINCGASATLVAPATVSNTYTLSSAPCAPANIVGTNAFATPCDDCVTGQIPMGFNFNFFGNTYNTAVISSNGMVGFGAFTFTGFTPFTIPAGGAPNNYIAGMMADIDIRFGGTIRYATIGAPPNRRFVVSYSNVVPFGGGTAAGTGTASFQIIINESGSFQVVVSQLSANWSATTSGVNATSGCENITGTFAIPVPGRNAQDWPGITVGNQDCNTFTPWVCAFNNWTLGGTVVSTTPSYTVSPTSTTTYVANWTCNGTPCSDNVIVTLNNTITPGTPINNSSCITPNGSIPFTSSGFVNGNYTLNYTLNGVPTSSPITITSNAFTLSGLNSGTYANFSITTGGCNATAAGPFTITSPTLPVTTSATICQGGTGSLTTSTCGVAGVPIAQGAVFNTGNLTATDPTWNRPLANTVCFTSGTTVYYDVYSFYVSTAGSYTFRGCFPNIDGYGHLYQNAFTPAAPCGTPGNFIIGDDDGNTALCAVDPSLTAVLTPGVQYFLISNSFGTGATDSYSWTFTGPPGATISNSPGSTIQWYTAPSGGTSISSAASFNPVGVAGSGLLNTNTPGTYTYYAACSNAPTCRTAANFVISPNSVVPTSINGTGSLCQGQSATLSVNGGSLANGANWTWYSGSCGGTVVGTGPSITVNPTSNTTYFVGASAGTSCPASACVSGIVAMPAAGTTLANNADNTSCIVNQNGYVHFYHSSGRLICSINSNGQNLGTVTATAYVGTPVTVPACDNPSWVVSVMGREWLINPEFQPTAVVNVRLPFDNSEFTTLVPVANGNVSPFDDLATIGDLKLSKYSGPLNMDNDAFNNCPSAGGSGGTTIHNQAANGNVNSYLAGFNTAGRFVQFNINSFSEFWLHGSNNASPLPVVLKQFGASCLDNNNAKITWETESEQNCEVFILERSEDGFNWNSLYQVTCSGPMGGVYDFVDQTRTKSLAYYRLLQVDEDGEKTYFEPLSLACNIDSWFVSSYPNPANDLFTVQIESPVSEELTAELLDLSGKVLAAQKLILSAEQTSIPFDTKTLSNGVYSVRLRTESGKVAVIKLIVQH
jgi:hypothetical protein